MVQIEVRIPFGGEQIRVGDLQLVDEASVTTVADRQSSLRYGTERTFADGVVGGQVAPSVTEFGVDFDVLPKVLPGDTIDLDLGVRSRIPDPATPVFPVPTLDGNVKLQLPELRTLDLQTRVLVDSGQTLVLGGLQAGDTEMLVFVEPNLVTGDNVVVASRVVVFGGDPREPKRDGEESHSAKDLNLVSREEQPMYLSRTSQHDVVTGHDVNGPVVSPLEVGTRLEFKPTLLGGDQVLLEVVVDDSELDPAGLQFPLKTPQGKGALDLPIVHTTQVDTALSVDDGQTLVIGGLRHDELRSRSRERAELLVLVTPTLDADDVEVGARVVKTSQGAGPARDSVERAESGPADD